MRVYLWGYMYIMRFLVRVDIKRRSLRSAAQSQRCVSCHIPPYALSPQGTGPLLDLALHVG